MQMSSLKEVEKAPHVSEYAYDYECIFNIFTL